MEQLTIAQLWDICFRFLWDDRYVKDLDRLLKKHNTKTVLDCAGGTGFPSIQLKQLGWDVTYSDGSDVMVEYFVNKISALNLDIPYHHLNWSRLDDIHGTFDAVLCRGNSLIYIDSWGENNISKDTPRHIKQSLTEFKERLKPQGMLLVDTIKRDNFEQTYPIVKNFGEKIIDGQKISVQWELSHDYEKNIRTWDSFLEIDGMAYEFNHTAYLLHPDTLISILKEIGFTNIQPVYINGGDYYDAFVASM